MSITSFVTSRTSTSGGSGSSVGSGGRRAWALRASTSVGAALIVLLAATVPGAPAGANGATCGLEGEGTASSPHLVEDADDLALVGVSPCALSAHYRQTEDIDLDGVAFVPIAAPYGTDFTGVYDGGGHIISGAELTVTSMEFGFGLFASVAAPGVIRNVNLREVEVVAPESYSVGALVGDLFAGGMVERSSATGSVTGYADVGGLVGQQLGTLRYSWADVVVNAVTPVSATNFPTTVAGGLVGNLRGSGIIQDSYSRGRVNVDEDYAATDFAGLVGYIGVVLFPTSAVDARVMNSYATGFVEAENAAGQTDAEKRVGGLVGGAREEWTGAVAVSFWDRDTTGQTTSVVNATTRNDAGARSTAQMTSIATFRDAGWLIVNGWAPFQPDPSLPNAAVWGIAPSINDGYPFLLWEYDTDPVPPVPTTGNVSGPSFVVGADGSVPLVAPGAASWQQVDGSNVPLTVSSPAPGQVRYEADGLVLTLTGADGTDASRGLVADPDGEIVCEVCATLTTGAVIETWLFSTPRLVAAAQVTELPCQRFTVPVGAPLDGAGAVTAGAHTLQLALPTTLGMQAVNVGVTIGGPVPVSVPAGQGPAPVSGLALLLLLAASGALLLRRGAALAR
jgi:hypothetical protein